MVSLLSRDTAKHHHLYETSLCIQYPFYYQLRQSKKPPHQTKKPQNNQHRLVSSMQVYPVSSTGPCLGVYSEHFLCQALKISTTHCHENTGNPSISTLSNTSIHVKSLFQLFTWITDIEPLKFGAAGIRTDSYVPQTLHDTQIKVSHKKKKHQENLSVWDFCQLACQICRHFLSSQVIGPRIQFWYTTASGTKVF